MRFIAAVLVLCAVAGWTQVKNPVTSVIQEILPRQAKNLQGAVEMMPSYKFSFKPTPQQISYGHLDAHVVSSNY